MTTTSFPIYQKEASSSFQTCCLTHDLRHLLQPLSAWQILMKGRIGSMVFQYGLSIKSWISWQRLRGQDEGAETRWGSQPNQVSMFSKEQKRFYSNTRVTRKLSFLGIQPIGAVHEETCYSVRADFGFSEMLSFTFTIQAHRFFPK